MVLSATLSGRTYLALRIKPVELNRWVQTANLPRSMGIVKRSVIATDHLQRKTDFFNRRLSCEQRAIGGLARSNTGEPRSDGANPTPETALRTAKCVFTAELRIGA